MPPTLQVIRVTLPAANDPRARLMDARRLRNWLVHGGYALHRGEHTTLGRRMYLEIAEPTQLAAVKALVDAHLSGCDVLLAKSRGAADACVNCGNIADEPHAVCPNCEMREIEGCPNCQADIPRQLYQETALGSRIYACPKCHTKVQLSYKDPMYLDDGRFNEPLVLVRRA